MKKIITLSELPIENVIKGVFTFFEYIVSPDLIIDEFTDYIYDQMQ